MSTCSLLSLYVASKNGMLSASTQRHRDIRPTGTKWGHRPAQFYFLKMFMNIRTHNAKRSRATQVFVYYKGAMKLTVCTLLTLFVYSFFPATLSAEAPLEIIVKFDDTHVDMRAGDATAPIAQSNGALQTDAMPEENIAVVVPRGQSVEATIARLNDDPRVEYAEPNYARTISDLGTNDTHAGLLWGLDNTGQSVSGTSGTAGADISMRNAWNISTGTVDIIVAVIDTGVLYTHPDLANRMWDGTSCVSDSGEVLGGCTHGYDFVSDDKDPLPGASDPDGAHGTHVAGTIAAERNNGLGIAGVAPRARIMALRFDFDVTSEVRAIDFARRNGAKVINASYTGGGFSQAEHDAIERFEASGGIFIAAAGNNARSNDATPLYPASYSLANTIAVAATDQNDNLATFSNYGGAVNVGAPGVNILSTYLPSPSGIVQYAYANGTSMAAPHVAGLAALIWSYNPTLSLTHLEALIESSGDMLASLSGTTQSGRRINAESALATFSPHIGATSDDILPSWALLEGTSTVDIRFKVRDGLSGLPISISSFLYSTSSEWSAMPLSAWSNPGSAYMSALDYSGATSTLRVDLAALGLSSVPRFSFTVSDGATSSPAVVTDAIAPAPPPAAVLSELPNALDASATPRLSAAVGGDGVTAYKFSLDSAAWSTEHAVTSRITANDLLNATHTLSVVGKNASGVWQSIASSTNYGWSVADATAPALSGLSDDATTTRSKSWDWSSDDAYAGYRFLIDTASTSPSMASSTYASATTTTISTGNGSFYFHIQAVDSNANESAILTYSFILDTTPPTSSISGATTTTSAEASFTIGGESVVEYQYSLDSGAWSSATAVSTTLTLSGLANGTHTLFAIGKDSVGNWQSTDTPTSIAFTVAIPPPAPAPAPASSGGGGGGGGGGGSAPAASSGGGGGGGGGGNLPIPIPTIPTAKASIKGDADGDGSVGLLDFNALMVHWGASGAGDTNNDGVVDLLDFNSIMINWTLV
ncbi:MAG: S8 family serine peptidase [bacterium]|nr:S8 family serine peptidase [bacterium]